MKRFALLFASIILLAGCAHDLPPVLFMPNNVDSSTSPTTESAMGDVVVTAAPAGVGGHISAGNFRVALIETLKRANIFGADAALPIKINAEIVRAEFPSAGFTMTSTLDVRYVVTAPNGSSLMDEVIRYTGQATTGEEFFGSARSLLAFQRTNQGHFNLLIGKLRDSVKSCCKTTS